MVNLLKRIGSTLSTHRVRKTAARWLAVLVVFATTYSLVLPAITKSSDLRGELEDVTVRVVAAEDALPSGTALALNNVLLPEDAESAEDVDSRRLTEEEVQLILDAAVDGEEGLEGKILKALDISLDHSGDEIEPNGPVRLHIRSDLIRNANRPAIVHLDDEGVATLVAVVQEDGDTVIELAGESKEPAESEEATEPAEPAESEEATEPTEPVESEEPAEPVESEEPTEPVESVEPAAPAEPAEPVEPTEPAANEEPVVAQTDELSGMTDSFSVYAIVDLTPKAEEEEPGAETLTFTGSVEDMDVNVTAPVTAFPEGTTMQVAMVPVEEVEAAVSEAVTGEVQVIKAVDITFYNAEGEEIEPSEPISVVMTPHEQIAEIAEAENDAQLVHIGKNETTVMSDAAVGADEVSFESGEFSTYVIVIPLGKPGTHTYEGDGVTITVTYGPEASLPEGTSLVVRELEEGTDEYDEYLAKTESALNLDTSVISMEDVSLEAQLAALLGGEQKVEKARFFDITLEHNGEKVEPAAPVDVEIKFDDASEASEGMQIVHFAEQTDGTEKPEVIAPTVENDTVTYQQESFSVTAAAIAKSYGNAGWFNNGRLEIHYGRTKENGVPIFELAYIDGKLPGDEGFPVAKASAQFEPGTTIEEIINALNANNNYNNEFRQHCTVVDFMMHDTYVVNDDNWKHNGSRENVSEIWQGPQVGDKTIQVKITRNGGFAGPLVRVKTSWSHPLHTMNGVIIDNAANQVPGLKTAFDGKTTGASYSEPVAVEIDDVGLLMMMGNSHITDSQVSGYGTGVKLVSSTGTTGGNLELFQQSYIEKMAVGVEQVCGKTRLKDATNPLGTRNTVGVALAPGQSIGKWIGTIDGVATPVFLREVKSWKSGDIVMDSGYIAVNNQSVKVDVVASDMNKLIFENEKLGQTTNTRMGLEFVEGSKKDPYPVIRFRTGTVLNTRTREWYATLHDAVAGINPVMLPGEQRPSVTAIQDGDVLEFYGDTVEGQNITINHNLTIRSSTTDAGHANGYGHAQTAVMSGTTITVASGKTVTIEGGTGGLTLSGTGSNTIITNNGTLNLKSGTVLSNGKYAVDQNGTFNLYEGVTFEGNKTADVRLEADNKYITLQTANPTAPVKVELANKYNGRDVVVAGEENNVRGTLNGDYLEKFPLTNPDPDNYTYVYNATGGPGEVRALELKQTGSALIRIKKVDSTDNSKIQGVEFTIYKDSSPYTLLNEKNPHVTDENGETSITVKAGTYTIKETKAAPGYETATAEYTFTVTAGANDSFTIDNENFTTTDNVTFNLTVQNTPKTVNVRFVKTDGKNRLAGAEFELYDVNPENNPNKVEPIATGTSDSNGIFFSDVKELRMGRTYYLVETKAPEYFLPMNETVSININENSDGSTSVVLLPKQLTQPKPDDSGVYTITIPNSPGVALPNTGGPGTALYTTAGLALVLIAAAALVLELKRKGRVRA